jgi:hypothetical protein
MRTAGAGFVGLLFAFAAHAQATGHAGETPTTPAVWYHYDVIVDLQDLPKPYTCDELWYKFRDILLIVGAQPDMEIVPYQCDSLSPRVQIRFSFPKILDGSLARYASLQAVTDTVHLEAGHPRSLDVADCALLQQIKDTLLAGLPLRMVSDHFACPAVAASHRSFGLTVQTLRAANHDGSARVAQLQSADRGTP